MSAAVFSAAGTLLTATRVVSVSICRDRRWVRGECMRAFVMLLSSPAGQVHAATLFSLS